MTSDFNDGTVPFPIPGGNQVAHTYYKVYGNLHGSTPPIVFLHGGPGSGHEYFAPFIDLYTNYGIPLLFYDQIGCGTSTHLPEMRGDHDFWTMDLFVAELENLLKSLDFPRVYDLIGHSFGGMIAIAFASSQPAGLRRMILMGTNASIPLSQQGIQELITRLSEEHRGAFAEARRTDDFTSHAYKVAVIAFERRFICRAPDPYPPEDLEMRYKHQREDDTVRSSLLGRIGKFDGSMKDYSTIPLLHEINVPTMVLKGENDTALDRSVNYFFDLIPRVRWLTLAEGSHFFWLDSTELREKAIQVVWKFLQPSEAEKS